MNIRGQLKRRRKELLESRLLATDIVNTRDASKANMGLMLF